MVTIYYITDGIHNKFYIGCTAGKVGKRWREHRCLLKNGKHKCRPLQDAWDLSEGIKFACRVIEYCEPQMKRERELYYLNLYKEQGNLYNQYIQSFSPPEGAPAKAAAARVANGYRPSAESNEKRRLAQLGKPKGHGAKISATKRAKAMR